jgi:hypothetical protein
MSICCPSWLCYTCFLSCEFVITVLHAWSIIDDDVLSLRDRSNIGNARIAGLSTDLGLKGLEYNTAVAVFFVYVTSTFMEESTLTLGL